MGFFSWWVRRLGTAVAAVSEIDIEILILRLAVNLLGGDSLLKSYEGGLNGNFVLQLCPIKFGAIALGG